MRRQSCGLGLKVKSGAWAEAGSVDAVAGAADADGPDDAGARAGTLFGATTGSVCPKLRQANTRNSEASFDIGFIPTL